MEGSGELRDRQESAVVHTASATVLAALSLSGGALVVLATVALVVIVAVAFLLTGGPGSAYDQIGAGGIAREGEYDAVPAAAGESPARARGARAGNPPTAERAQRKARAQWPAGAGRRCRAGAIAGGRAGRRDSDRPDPELVAEVRSLVVARNERRLRQGMEPLDVEAEVKRALEQLGP